MYRPRLFYPGNVAAYASPIAERVTSLANYLDSRLDRAAVSLSIFEQVELPELSGPEGQPSSDAVATSRALWQSAYRSMLYRQDQGSDADYRWREKHALDDLARHVERSRTRNAAPGNYNQTVALISAESFVFALDGAGQAILQLERVRETGLAGVYAEWQAAFPGLKETRDAAHHSEERAQGKEYGRDLPRPAFSEHGFVSEAGGSLVVSAGIVDGHYVTTGRDGIPHSVPITSESLDVAADLVQRTIGEINWLGTPHFTPVL